MSSGLYEVISEDDLIFREVKDCPICDGVGLIDTHEDVVCESKLPDQPDFVVQNAPVTKLCEVCMGTGVVELCPRCKRHQPHGQTVCTTCGHDV